MRSNFTPEKLRFLTKQDKCMIIILRPDEYVTIELDVDRPYIYFDKHRKEFPPGKKYRRHKGRHGMH